MYRKTALYMQQKIGFGDWLILTMVGNHLDLKVNNQGLGDVATLLKDLRFFFIYIFDFFVSGYDV